MTPSDPTIAEQHLTQTAWVHGLARALVRDVHLAEDAAQEACLAALARADRGESSMRGWLTKVTRNAVHKTRRSDRRRVAREQRAAKDDAEPSTLEVIERFSVQQEVSAAVMALAEPYREVVLLRFYEELPLKEIARRLNVTTATVDGRVRRGLDKLRAALDREHGRDGNSWALALLPLVEAPSRGTLLAPLWGLLSRPAAAVVAAVLLGMPVLRAIDGPAEIRPGVAGDEARSRTASETSLMMPHSEAGRGSPDGVALNALANSTSTTFGRGSLDVAVHAADGLGARDVLVQLTPEQTADAVRPGARRTDAQGTAHFENLVPGEYQVHAGWGLTTSIEVAAAQHTQATLQLPGGPALVGTVVDARGAPVPGAGIWVSANEVEMFRGGRLITTEVDGEPAVVADGAGRFQLSSIGAARLVGARAAGYAPSLAHSLGHLEGDPRRVRLVLPGPGGTLAGTLRDSSGTVVADASVYLDDSEGASPLVVHRSDVLGRFQFVGVTPGTSRLVVRAAGWARHKRSVAVVAGEVHTVDFTLETGGRAHGVVTDAEGRPVVDALVFASRLRWSAAPGERYALATRTARDGSYCLSGLAAGPCWVTVDAGDRGRDEQLIQVENGGQHALDVQVIRGPQLAGRVVDSAGEAIAGCTVLAARLGDWRWETVLTDATGCFRFSNCAPRPHTLHVQEYGVVMLRRRMSPGEDEATLVVPIENRPSARLRGTLVDSAGVAVELSELRLVDRERGRDLAVRVTSQADGSFRSDPIPPGDYAVTAQPRERELVRLHDEPLSLAAQAEIDLGLFTLPRVELLELDFARADREPLRDLRIILTPIGEPDLRRWSFPRAEQFLPLAVHLPAGSYSLVAWAAGSQVQSRRVGVQIGQPVSLTSTLLQGAQQRFRFIAPEGTHLLGRVRFEIGISGGERVLAEEFAHGTNVLSAGYALQPGAYTFRIETSAGLVGSGEFVVRDGAQAGAPIDCQLKFNANTKGTK